MLGWIKTLLGLPDDGGGLTRGSRELADRGENTAARFLQSLGYKIIARNVRLEVGEIDIVARDGRTLVFVEVKTRSSDDDASPESAVDADKQHQVTKAAKVYLSRYGTPRPPARFDVVAIVWPPGRKPRITHHQNAYEVSF